MEDEKMPPDNSATSTELLAHISTYCQINPAIPFLQNPQFKKLVPHAIEKSIREIIGPVVERSVTIACITTRELIVKDFAMEPDENKMRKSAHMMVQHLASSLALVTCKEPLRVSMSTHLHTLLAPIILDAPGLDQVIQTLCAENLDLACSIIEKSATEKALAETDEQLASAYAKRKLHRERAPTQVSRSNSHSDCNRVSSHYYHLRPFSTWLFWVEDTPQPFQNPCAQSTVDCYLNSFESTRTSQDCLVIQLLHQSVLQVPTLMKPVLKLAIRCV